MADDCFGPRHAQEPDDRIGDIWITPTAGIERALRQEGDLPGRIALARSEWRGLRRRQWRRRPARRCCRMSRAVTAARVGAVARIVRERPRAATLRTVESLPGREVGAAARARVA